MRFKFPAVVLFFTFIFVSCSTIPDPPPGKPFNYTVPREISDINLPVELKAVSLQNLMNKVFNGTLYQGTILVNGFKIVVKKRSNMLITANDGFLHVNLPLQFDARFGSYIGAKTVKLNLKFKTRVKLTPDWKLNTETYYTGIYGGFPEKIAMGAFKFNVREIVEKTLNPVQKKLSDMLNKKINEKLKLKERVAKVWTHIQRPIYLSKKYNMWLKLTPVRISMFPITFENNSIKFSIGLKSYTDAVVGRKPIIKRAPPLPKLNYEKKFQRKFKLGVTADISYGKLIQMVKSKVIGKVIKAGANVVRINDFSIYGNGPDLVVMVDVAGTANGKLYLMGQPSFDPKKNILSLKNFDFDIRTKNAFVNSANWLLHSKFRDEIKNRMNINIGKEVTEAKNIAKSSIKSKKVAPGVFLKGSFSKIEPGAIYITPDKLMISIFSEGETSLIIN